MAGLLYTFFYLLTAGVVCAVLGLFFWFFLIKETKVKVKRFNLEPFFLPNLPWKSAVKSTSNKLYDPCLWKSLFQQDIMDHICILGTANTDVVTVVGFQVNSSSLGLSGFTGGCSLNQSQIHAWRDAVRPHWDFHTFLPNIAYRMDYLNSNTVRALSSACIKLFLRHALLDRQYRTPSFEAQQSGLIRDFRQLDTVI